MTMRTPLNKVLHHGSAKSGTDHFWQQRLTAIANLPLTLFLIWFFLSLSGASHGEVVSSIKQPFVAFGLIATIISYVWHMRLGIQVVIEDYAHGNAKVIFVIGNIMFCALIALVSIFAILKISFGA